MKKVFLLFFVVCSLGISSVVFATRVVKSYIYDYNVFTGVDSNYHSYQYINIPSSSTFMWQNETKIGGGWNYNRYQVVKYYSGGY